MANDFDLVVIGVGTAAMGAAKTCAAAGWRVAVIDERPYGGTCALRGCDPKKMLRRGAEVVEAARLMQGKGIEPGGLAINWPDLMAFKRSFTEAMPPRIEKSLAGKGIVTCHGRARFVGPSAVEVEGETGGQRLQARRVLIASGAEPRPLDLPGAEHLIDSTAFLELEDLPRRILFAGGGLVSFEFAHITARAGAEVTIVDRGARPLKAFDPDLVDKLLARSRRAGIAIELETALSAIEKTGEGYRVSAETGGRPRHWDVDLVVHGAGRVPALDRLDLPAAGIEREARGVAVNAYLQSVSNPAVYASGDAAATAGAPLTPVASLESKIAAENLLHGNRTTPDYRGVPSTVFTLPELARVGLSEAEARERGGELRVAFNDTGGWYSSLRVGEDCAAAKVISDRASGELLGAHLLGHGYGELVNLFALAIRLGLTTADLGRLVSAYPSLGSDVDSML